MGILDGLKALAMENGTVLESSSALMADWGADIIKVEPVTGRRDGGVPESPGAREMKVGGVTVNPLNQFTNRNKRSLAVDLKQEAGRDILCQLVQKSDVFMANFEVNSLKKLRLGYDTLSQLNPGLVYVSVNGYGSQGPDKDEQAFDETAFWARSGIQYLLTEPGRAPIKRPGGLGDRITSGHLVSAVLGSLLHKEKTGKGQEIEISLFHSGLWSIARNIQAALSGVPQHPEIHSRQRNPLTNSYRTKDNRWIQIFDFHHPQTYWPEFCQALGRPELENDLRFASVESRAKNCEELIRIIDEVFATRTVEEWEGLLRKYHQIYSRMQTPEEVAADPQALANDFFVDLPHPAGPVKILASPVRFRQDPASMRTPAPEPGQNTEEILLDLGYSRERIAGLKEQGVIL
ncbi:MAG: CoA transferase [Dehalococcoidales bacterium]|nr:CoA transferase [Dehalococcoidales bacterium]